jgi:hypothetical protein
MTVIRTQTSGKHLCFTMLMEHNLSIIFPTPNLPELLRFPAALHYQHYSHHITHITSSLYFAT